MLLNILQDTGRPLTAKHYPAHNVNSAEVEKPWPTGKSAGFAVKIDLLTLGQLFNLSEP